MMTLEDYYAPVYSNPDKVPIKVTVNDNTITIDAWFRYNRAAIRPWIIDGMCQADLIEAAIIRFWSGHYRLRTKKIHGRFDVEVKVNIRRRQKHSVPISVRPLFFMPAHVISPWFRRVWGIFKTRQLESLGTNWSVRQPGKMILPPVESAGISRFEHVAAHEAGHLFGLGDAYGAIYRFYYEAPGTRFFMMNSNRRVQSREILMLLEAHQTRRMQFFPRKWSWRKFRQGFIKELDRTSARLERNWKDFLNNDKTNQPRL